MRVQCGNCRTHADYVASAGMCEACGRQFNLLSGADRKLDDPLPVAPYRRIRLVWCVSGACVLALVALFAYAQVRGWTPSKVERAVNRDLPPGSDRAQIEAYLDAEGWAHSYCADADTLDYYGRAAGLRVEQLGGVVIARVPDPNVGIGGLDHGSITVFFFLDRDGYLVRSYVRVSILSL